MRNYPKIPSQLPPTDICSEVAPVVLYNIDQSEKVVIPNHDKLNNLDKPNQHPIEAIIGLQEELSRLDNKEVVFEEVDPTVPNWAKQENKPEYTFDEVGALSKDTKLSDLPQDNEHLTVSEEEKERWDRTISYEELIDKPVIPTKLAQLEQDDEHLTVTLSEKQQWNSGTGDSGGFSGNYNDLLNKPFIPTKLADLEEDNSHRTVTTEQINEWSKEIIIPEGFSGDYNDLTNKPVIPSQLSELIDDSEHRTVTDAEKELWTKGGENVFSGSYNDLIDKPFIPTQLAELTIDEEHQTVTAAEKEYWNSLESGGNNFSGDYNDLINKPTLAQLEQDDEHQTVTATDKENWNSKLSSQQNVEDAGKIFTIDIDGKTIYKPLSELVSGLTWGILAGKS